MTEYLTVKEAAQILKMSQSAIYRAIYRGEIPAVKVGKSVRIPARALEESLKPFQPLQLDMPVIQVNW